MSEELDLSTEDETQSMDDTIRETLDAINARGEVTDEAEVTEPEASAEVEQQEARARDEKGRFAKAETSDTPDEVDPSRPAPVDAPTFTVPPELQKLGLRKEEVEAIASNPVAMQAVIRRSEEMHRGLEQYRGKAEFADRMERAIQPYAPILQQMGVAPEFAIQRLFQAETMLRQGTPEQKSQMFMQLARDYGVDLPGVAERAASMPPVDPQIQTLQSQLQQMQGWIQQQSNAREWQERQALNSEIERFKSDPAHVHFEDVKEQMAGLLQAGLATDLKAAYDMAVYANPNVRTKVLAEQQAQAEAKRVADAKARAEQAKAAAAVNVKRKGTLPAAKPIGSMDDTIRETARSLGLM